MLAVLFCFPCYAQQDQFFVIDDFSKLLNSHVSPYLVKDSSAVDVLNVRANDQYGALAKRSVLNLLGTCHASAVTSLHRYYKSDATKYTIESSDTYLDYISDAGVCTNLFASATSGLRWSWVTYKDMAIGMNGTDRAKKWDGKTQVTANTDASRTAGDLVADLGAPFAELNTGANLDANAWYQYKIAYFDGTNYSYSNARSNPLLTGAAVQNIYLTDIPLGPTGTTSRVIYRTVGDADRATVAVDTAFYKVTTISNNSTQVLADVSTDTAILADQAPTWTTVSAGIDATPPKAKYPFIHKERLWAGNDPSGTSYGKSTVYFSSLLKPDHWLPSSNYFLVRPDDGDEVTFIKSYYGYLFIGKVNTISKINTDSSSTSNWALSQPTSFVGCAAPFSVQSTPIGLIYLGKYGIYQFDGNSSKVISDVVSKDIRDINPANYSNIAGVYYNNEYRLVYTSQATGSGINDRVLIYDFMRDSYTKDSENVNSWAIYDSADDFGALYSGASDASGKIMAHTSSPSNFVIRYYSELTNSGATIDSALAEGYEDNPTLSIGWGVTLDSSVVTIDSATYDTAIVDRPKTTGTWYSQGYKVGASKLSKLYWNENLGATGNVTFAIRTASTEAGLTSAVYSAEFSDPSGSDVSGVTANTWIQFRITMTTSDINYTPYLSIIDSFMFKLTYSKTGLAGETSVASLWETGWIPFSQEASQYPKLLREVDVYYEGTAGTVTFTIKNLKGDVVGTFDIDLSKNRKDTQQYWGSGNSKVYRYNTPSVPTATNYLFGDKFKIIITENGTTEWKIQRLVIRWAAQEYKPY